MIRFPIPATIFRRLTQPMVVGLVLSTTILAWIAWRSVTLLIPPPIKSADLSARQVRVKSEELTKLKERLDLYEKPAAPVAVPEKIFIPLTTPDETSSG